MKKSVSEIIAIVATVMGIAGTLILPFVYEGYVVSKVRGAGQVITLTGVASAGVWTDEEVHAGDYWYGQVHSARPVLRLGETTALRLKSADVIHTFYAPALGIGPVKVYPGHVVEIEVTPRQEGVFEYFCTTICGMPHFGMRGEMIVSEEPSAVSLPALTTSDEYWLEALPPPDAPVVERGQWLFRQKGCFTCHGEEGQGGVTNWNYTKDTVPALNTLAERLMLFYPEDVEAIIESLEKGMPLESLSDSPPVPRFNVVLAQYRSVRDVIRDGNPPGKREAEGPAPPLEMLAWGQRLSEKEIEALIAYLLTLQPWEDEDY